MRLKSRFPLLLSAAFVTSACGGRYLGSYEETGDGDFSGDGDLAVGDGDGDFSGDGDGDGDFYGDGDGDFSGDGDGDFSGDGDGDFSGDGDGDLSGDGDGDGDTPIVVPPDVDPSAPLGSCTNPLVLTSSGTSGQAGSGWDRYAGPCPGSGEDLVFYFQAPRDGIYTFDTRGSFFDATLHLTTEPCGGTVLDCNDDYYDLDSLVGAQLLAGQAAYVILQAYDGSVEGYVLNVGRTDIPGTVTCPSASLGNDLGQPLIVQEVAEPPPQELPYDAACNGGPPLLSYSWTAPASSNYVFSTSGSNFDTVLALRASCGGSLYNCNDDGFNTTASRLEEYFDEGQTIVVEISAYGGNLYFDEDADFGGPTVVLNIWQD